MSNIFLGKSVELKRELGLPTAIFIVIASMVGPGVFITTGTILKITGNGLLVLGLWLIAGLVALTGSLCYGELASIWPEAGGEFFYLKKIYGFFPAFLSGWISLMVGFSASIATSALILVEYLNRFLLSVDGSFILKENLFFSVKSGKILAVSIVLLFALIHIRGLSFGSRLQNFLTVIKIFVILTFIAAGILAIDWGKSDRIFALYSTIDSVRAIPEWGIGLLIIMFSYSGWNSAAYIGGEIKNPEKNLPRALFWGTAIVLILYLLLNTVFIFSSPVSEIIGVGPIGAVVSKNLFGSGVFNLFTLGIILILLSSISVQMMIGPRVYYAMGREKMIFSKLTVIHKKYNTPYVSIIIQMFLAIFYIIFADFKYLMEYLGFTLSIFPLLAIIGVVYLRMKMPDLNRPYRVPFLPIVAGFFIFFTLFMLFSGLFNWAGSIQWGVVVLLAGSIVYFIRKKFF